MLFTEWFLLFRKPADGEEDPDLVREIESARTELGQFTRKTSDEFENLEPVKVEEQSTRLIQLLLKVKEKN